MSSTSCETVRSMMRVCGVISMMAYSVKYPFFSHLLKRKRDAAPKAYPVACDPMSVSVQLAASSAGSAMRNKKAMHPSNPTTVLRQSKRGLLFFEFLLLCSIVAFVLDFNFQVILAACLCPDDPCCCPLRLHPCVTIIHRCNLWQSDKQEKKTDDFLFER